MSARGALVLAAAAILGTAGCGTTPATSTALEGRSYVSQSVTEAGAVRSLVGGTRIVLSFAKGSMSASAGCNGLGADYRLEGDAVLVLSGAAATTIGCDEALMAQDAWLFALLGNRPHVATTADKLTVTSGTTVIMLLDRRLADPDRPLVGTHWVLDTLWQGSGTGAVASTVTVTAWLELDAHGGVHVLLGCNQGDATFRLRSDQLIVDDLVTTKKACFGESARVEDAFREVLTSTPAFVISHDRLTLGTDHLGLAFVAR